MSFGDAIRTCLRKYADFTGRARRSEYWWFILFTFIAEGVASTAFGDNFGGAVALAFFLPTLAAAVRRLHDADHSAWSLLLILLPLIGWTVLIVWLATAGTGSENRYGPPPA
ncbi:MAG: DUF805 domain-containing protein [Actinomycetota bacterium]